MAAIEWKHYITDAELSAIETLLTAYEKEKEKNNKIKWKPIKDYDRKKYDWVLVKYFDGDYECVPEVAEKRSDGKWILVDAEETIIHIFTKSERELYNLDLLWADQPNINYLKYL